MRAMVLRRQGEPLRLEQRELPPPGPGQVAIAISACGVCRTDLHVIDGDLTGPKLPLVPGHEIVGRISALGSGVDRGVTGLAPGDRVGVPWLGHTCGHCPSCRPRAQNLRDAPGFTGSPLDGAYSEGCLAHPSAA